MKSYVKPLFTLIPVSIGGGPLDRRGLVEGSVQREGYSQTVVQHSCKCKGIACWMDCTSRYTEHIISNQNTPHMSSADMKSLWHRAQWDVYVSVPVTPWSVQGVLQLLNQCILPYSRRSGFSGRTLGAWGTRRAPGVKGSCDYLKGTLTIWAFQQYL